MTTLRALQICSAPALLAWALLATPAGAAEELPLTPVLTDASYPEGPLADGDGLLFADMSRGEIVRFDGRTARRWTIAECGPTSLSRFRTGFVVTCHLADALAFVRLPEQGAEAVPVASRLALAQPNDSSAAPDGGVFVSSAGLFQPDAQATGELVRLSPGGDLSVELAGLHYANGVAAAAARVLVSEHFAGVVWSLSPSSGTREVFATIADRTTPLSGPDGIEILPDGRFLVAVYGEGRIDAFDAQGFLLFRFRAPPGYPVLTNMALMPDGRTVYATASTDASGQRGALLAGTLPPSAPE